MQQNHQKLHSVKLYPNVYAKNARIIYAMRYVTLPAEMASLQQFRLTPCMRERHQDMLSLVVLYLVIAHMTNKLVLKRVQTESTTSTLVTK